MKYAEEPFEARPESVQKVAFWLKEIWGDSSDQSKWRCYHRIRETMGRHLAPDEITPDMVAEAMRHEEHDPYNAIERMLNEWKECQKATGAP